MWDGQRLVYDSTQENGDDSNEEDEEMSGLEQPQDDPSPISESSNSSNHSEDWETDTDASGSS